MHFLCYFSKFNIIFVILYIIFGSEPKQKRQIIQKKNPSHHEGFLSVRLFYTDFTNKSSTVSC
ncbi:hypothetical protein D7V83_16770 [bacterium 0.1xD8-71]|nr:hypothetical protein D7V83_16770 [bacterium 0.1xD8-71]